MWFGPSSSRSAEHRQHPVRAGAAPLPRNAEVIAWTPPESCSAAGMRSGDQRRPPSRHDARLRLLSRRRLPRAASLAALQDRIGDRRQVRPWMRFRSRMMSRWIALVSIDLGPALRAGAAKWLSAARRSASRMAPPCRRQSWRASTRSRVAKTLSASPSAGKRRAGGSRGSRPCPSGEKE